jgi:tripartite-type tricarboxylate transporter receptor subunit TctC
MIAGQVTMIFTTPVTAQPLVRAGRIKVLAVAGKKRLDIFPDVPTTAEQGLEGFDVNIWFGVSAPPAHRVRWCRGSTGISTRH